MKILGAGFSLFNSRDHSDKHAAAKAREARAIQTAFPKLWPGEINEENADAIFNYLCETIPAVHEPAREAHLRSSAWKLRKRAKSGIERDKISRLIAESDARSGVIYSRHVQKWPDLMETVKDQIAEHEAAYGAPVITRDWVANRGHTLAYYFGHHEHLIDRKAVLHIAPESETEAFFRNYARGNGIRYLTCDLFNKADIAEDLTAMTLADESMDLVICHRVLEHIFDDSQAIRELRRILRPGGILNVSIPQLMTGPAIEWAIPDASHHLHFREYGNDFANLLLECGFSTAEPVQWLLDMPFEKMDEAGLYPMRIYNAVKD